MTLITSPCNEAEDPGIAQKMRTGNLFIKLMERVIS